MNVIRLPLNGHCNINTQRRGERCFFFAKLFSGMVVAAIALFVSTNVAIADDSGTAVVWGYNEYGQTHVPPASGLCKAIAAGYDHAVGLQTNGTVVAWGGNPDGQCNVPANLGPCKAIAAGFFHTVALKENGTVVAWGYNYEGQCNVPANLGPCKAITAGAYHTVALKENGTVVAWGENYLGQCGTPAEKSGTGITSYWTKTTLGASKSVAAGFGHTVALKDDGTVVAWGAGTTNQLNGGSSGWEYGQSIVPANLASCISIAAGGEHTLVIKADGTALAWGLNDVGQCNVPATLGVCKAIAAGSAHNVALKANGSVVAWGYNNDGECGTITEKTGTGTFAFWNKTSLGACHAIAAGPGNSVAVRPFVDCDYNGIEDYFDTNFYGETDFNHDGVPDTCQGAIAYDITSPSLGIPTANVAVSYIFTNLVLPDNFADVPLTISARGDFDASNEFLTVKLNGVTLQRVFETDGINCASGTNTTTVIIPYATFANSVAVGQLTITLLPAPAVTASECGTGFMAVQMKYLGIGPDGDCNNNGKLDTRDIGANPPIDLDHNARIDACEIAENPLLDCNGNDVLDSYEIATGNPDDNGDGHLDECQYAKGDLDLSGEIDGGDLGIILLYWGEMNPAFGDFDGNGEIDGGDVGFILLNFGPVTWP